MNTNSYFVCLWLLFWTSRCSQFLLLLLVPNLSTDDTSPGGNASTTKCYKRCRKNNCFCNLLRIQLRVPNLMFSVMTFISHDRIWETKCSSRFWHWKKPQRNHVFPMVTLLFMHKIFPLFAFIYIKRLLCTLEKSRKTQKKCFYSPPFVSLWRPTVYVVLNVTCVPEQAVVFPLWFVKIRVWTSFCTSSVVQLGEGRRRMCISNISPHPWPLKRLYLTSPHPHTFWQQRHTFRKAFGVHCLVQGHSDV